MLPLEYKKLKLSFPIAALLLTLVSLAFVPEVTQHSGDAAGFGVIVMLLLVVWAGPVAWLSLLWLIMMELLRGEFRQALLTLGIFMGTNAALTLWSFTPMGNFIAYQ